MNHSTGPPGRHPAARTRSRRLLEAAPSEPLRNAADDTLPEHALKHMNPQYRCPMHPDILRDAPGECPICGMTLVKVEPRRLPLRPAAATRTPLYYRNPMDPNRHSPVPAKDEMGMDYVPVTARTSAAKCAYRRR